MSISGERTVDRNPYSPAPIRQVISWLSAHRAPILFAATWTASAIAVAARLDQSWIPWDDGAFAQSAHRVLEGQLPHREFADLYTGGMTFLNAGTFWLLGENLLWLRIPLFILFLAFVPCVYLIARRFVGPGVACLTALFAVTWSVPTYPAAVPSWYLLFFTAFGALCVIRYFESRALKWLFFAGLFGGLAISFKIVGIWYVLAVLMSLVVAAESGEKTIDDRRFDAPALLVAGASGLVTLLLALSILSSHLGASEIVNFLVPVAVLCCVPIAIEVRRDSGLRRARIVALCTTAGLFLVGVAAPLLVLAVPYVVSGSVGDLFEGVFVSPQTRLRFAYESTPGPADLILALPALFVLLRRRTATPSLRLMLDLPMAAAFLALVVTGGSRVSYTIIWTPARSLAPLVLIGGALVVVFGRRRTEDTGLRLSLVLLLFLAGFTSLVQFPFGAPVYFCYVAPLFCLAAVAMFGYTGDGRGVLPVSLLAGAVLFGSFFLEPLTASSDRTAFRRNADDVVLDAQKATIRVSQSDRSTYERVVQLLLDHSSSRYAYAGPDAPEVYFLSGLENPTRSLFDFLDTTGSARGSRLITSLETRNVTAVAIMRKPELSDPLDAPTLLRLISRYPRVERVGPFDVRWK